MEEGGSFSWDREVNERCNCMWEAHFVMTGGHCARGTDARIRLHYRAPS
jgi:hypothetical protein